MRIAITGASGFVGRMLIPVLEAQGDSVLAIGRDLAAGRDPSNQEYVTYTNLEDHLGGCDVLVHLATINNNVSDSIDAFRRVNVDVLVECAEAARKAGVPRFINVSSVKALDQDDSSPYAISKREGAEALVSLEWAGAETLFAGPIYGSLPPNRLRFLRFLPSPVRSKLLWALTAIHPMLHVDRLAEVIAASEFATDAEYPLTDAQVDNTLYFAVKRAVDLTFALVTVTLFGWIMLLTGLLVRLDSKGPAIFAQDRIGLDGKLFTIYKFRTMKVGSKVAGTHDMSEADLTRSGKVLRRLKLDELPQIINIFRNELSLVGPRPCLPTQCQVLAERRSRNVLAIKPGITGLAQVQGFDMSMPADLARKDAEYIALRSIVMDTKIILATFLGSGIGDRLGPDSVDGNNPKQ